MALAEIDHWIGKTLFLPPIIKFCQLTRQSQFAVSRLFWFVATLDALYHAETLLSLLVWGGMSIVMLVSAASRADAPAASFMFFRLLALLLLVVELARGAAMGSWAGTEFWLFVLIAEYAATIRTLPPGSSSARNLRKQSQGRSSV